MPDLELFKKLSKEYGDKYEISISNSGCIEMEPKEYEAKEEMKMPMSMPMMARSEKLK